VGLGKLGLPIAAGIAAKGIPVVGVDLNEKTVQDVNQGRTPVFEPGLDELMAVAGGRLSATCDYRAAVSGTDATFVLVPTPSSDDGEFSLEYVLAACEEIAAVLSHKAGYHLVVLASTVSPGVTGGQVRSALESASGKRVGRDFGLLYCPEFFALGTVIRDFFNPDMVLIGESDHEAGECLGDLYRRTCDNDPPIIRTNFMNAELAKLAVNTYVSSKITYANMIAGLCEKLPGADVDVVTGVLGADSRIGPKYLKGALGYGGPCFPRDQLALRGLGRRLDVPVTLAEATHELNGLQIPRLADRVQAELPAGGAVAVLGLAFKPGTDFLVESQGLELVRVLAERNIEVKVYDPVAMEPAGRLLPRSAKCTYSLSECVQGADVVVLATPWPEFEMLDPAELAAGSKNPVVIDCWRMLDRSRFEAVTRYIPLGVGPPG